MNCSRTVQCYADGYDGDTVKQLLQYLSHRFGPVSSWSSAYRTDAWSLNIERSGQSFFIERRSGQSFFIERRSGQSFFTNQSTCRREGGLVEAGQGEGHPPRHPAVMCMISGTVCPLP